MKIRKLHLKLKVYYVNETNRLCLYVDVLTYLVKDLAIHLIQTKGEVSSGILSKSLNLLKDMELP